ncbi:hypothetical protein O0881_22640 [Janthinobacterium sp. SUN100]|uniref:hypothetical protein n=1 Tax=Janthinobacterium sp. SUN100 TaxID=3004101 RepID=UPI0025B04A6F|nr:hypothetical protein [Janthinobacterium sp. SUN100]MDN2704787.1 hypothetical protein [Janthinobacterium sp. SUN100]
MPLELLPALRLVRLPRLALQLAWRQVSLRLSLPAWRQLLLLASLLPWPLAWLPVLLRPWRQVSLLLWLPAWLRLSLLA